MTALRIPKHCGRSPHTPRTPPARAGDHESAPLAACGGETDNFDVVNLNTITVNQHLYLKDGDGTKFEISVVKDASGKDVVTATRVGQ